MLASCREGLLANRGDGALSAVSMEALSLLFRNSLTTESGLEVNWEGNRMKRTLVVAISAVALVLAMASSALAHDLRVSHPHTGEVIQMHWVGGGPLPAQAQDAPPMFGPFNLPPSHAHGLPSACQNNNSPAVEFLAPPFGSCHHGQP